MSKQEKRSRGKRPRLESQPSREPPVVQGFAPVNYPRSSPTFSGPSSTHPEQSQPPQRTAFRGRGQNAAPGQQGLSIGMQAPPPGKVAIPALKTPQTADFSKSFKKGRTAHACDYCRRVKAGCTGGQPCARCRTAQVECVYGDGKRDRERKRMSKLSKETNSLTQHNYDVTEALRRIRLDTHLSSDDMRAALDDVIAMTPAPVTPDAKEGHPPTSNRASSDLEDQEYSDESSDNGDGGPGSTGSLDVISVNIDQDDNRATGHIGKSSSISWAKRTAEELGQSTHQEPILGRHDTGYTLASYHTEDGDVEYVDTSNIDPYEWPEEKLADRLVQTYFDEVHKTFPMIDKADFISKYDHFVRGSSNLGLEDSIWLATVNTIFAISSVYFDLTKYPYRGSHQDHLFYCARAKMLFLDQGMLYQDARVSTTSALGLLALYFIAVGRVNRAWMLCGLAIRHGLTLGLHVRSEAHDISDVEKEHRIRLWWSLYSLECTLNELTGRPSCISDRDTSTPFPLNMDEDNFNPSQALYEMNEKSPRSGSSSRRGSKTLMRRPSATYEMPTGISQPLAYTFPVLPLPVTSSTYFIYRTQLSIISHEIVTQLYCAATIKERWMDIQETVRRIDRRLLAWRDKLTPEFDITFEDTWTAPDWNDPNILARMGLAMQFSSSRMILFRPYLCRFEGRLKNRSENSKDFNQEAVKTCIRSARKMISLLSWSASSVEKLYAIPPWWNILHYICEALSVLMLEMAFKATHMPDEAANILDDAKKGIRWLAMMSAQSVSARKAWEIFDNLIRLVAGMIRWSVFDLPTQTAIPPGYNWQRFSAAPPPPLFHSPAPPFPASQPQQEQQQQPLSEHNLQQHSAAHQDITQPTDISTWHSAPGFNFPNYTQPFEQAANPLDLSTALQRFSHIGQLHGHYDEEWQHFFSFPHLESGLGLNTTDPEIMQGQQGPGAAGGGDRYPEPSYGNVGRSGYGAYPMIPTQQIYGGQFGAGGGGGGEGGNGSDGSSGMAGAGYF